jgi:hypothetical protein
VRTELSNESNRSGFGRSFEPFGGFLGGVMHPFSLTYRDVEIYAPRCEGLLLDIDRKTYVGRVLRTIDLPEVNVNEVTAIESR